MKIIGVGTNTIIPAIENDQVVAAMGMDPCVTHLVKRGKASLLADLRTEQDAWALFGGSYEFTGLLTRVEIIERRPAMIQKVVNALVKTNQWMAANPVEKWADVMPVDLVGDRTIWIESFKGSKETFAADSPPTREAVMAVLRTFETVGQIPNASKMDPEGLSTPASSRKPWGGTSSGRAEGSTCGSVFVLLQTLPLIQCSENAQAIPIDGKAFSASGDIGARLPASHHALTDTLTVPTGER